MMRRLMIMIVWLSVMATAKAQGGLNIAPLFEGKVIPQERMVETRVRGKMLSKYQLSFFRSVRFEARDRTEISRVHNLVEQDRAKFADSQAAENWSSQKTHAKETLMMQLPKQGGNNRFLSYKRKGDEVTVVYMEGTLSSFETLKNMLK